MPLSEFREWSSEDRGAVLALVVEGWDSCSGCGHPLSETTPEHASGQYTLDEVLCAGCEVLAAAAKGPDYPGRRVAVIRKN